MVNKLILGTVQFGLEYGISNSIGLPAEDSVNRMLTRAWDGGIRELDTAPAYGIAEDRIGNFCRKNEHAFRINSKFHLGNESSTTQLDRILKRLGLKQIHVYFFHRFSDFQSCADPTELRTLKDQGLIEKIGVSVYENAEFEYAISIPWIDVIQVPFNLFDNRFQRGVLMQRALEVGKTIQARSIFLQGFFFLETENIPKELQALKPYLEEIRRRCHIYGVSIETLALLYALRQPEFSGVLIGVDSAEQLDRNLISLQVSLPDELFSELDQIAVKETHLLYPKNWK